MTMLPILVVIFSVSVSVFTLKEARRKVTLCELANKESIDALINLITDRDSKKDTSKESRITKLVVVQSTNSSKIADHLKEGWEIHTITDASVFFVKRELV